MKYKKNNPDIIVDVVDKPFIQITNDEPKKRIKYWFASLFVDDVLTIKETVILVVLSAIGIIVGCGVYL